MKNKGNGRNTQGKGKRQEPDLSCISESGWKASYECHRCDKKSRIVRDGQEKPADFSFEKCGVRFSLIFCTCINDTKRTCR